MGHLGLNILEDFEYEILNFVFCCILGFGITSRTARRARTTPTAYQRIVWFIIRLRAEHATAVDYMQVRAQLTAIAYRQTTSVRVGFA